MKVNTCHGQESSKNIMLLCGTQQVTEWPLGPQGLLYDRMWMVVNENGVCLSQNREPKLCLINPHICLNSKTLCLEASGQTHFVILVSFYIQIFNYNSPRGMLWEMGNIKSEFCIERIGMDPITVPLEISKEKHGSRTCQSKVCGDR